MVKKTCSRCNSQNDDDANFCTRCGYKLQDQRPESTKYQVVFRGELEIIEIQ